MKLVLFDIDGTLIKGASTERRFARFLWQQRRIGLRQGLHFLWFTIRYFPRFGIGVFRKNKAYLAGIEDEEVQELADEFVRISLPHTFYEPACARVRHHLQCGDTVWLLSGTLQPIAESIAKFLRLERVLASSCPVRNGVLVARPPEQHPYGRRKLELAQHICGEAQLTMEQVVAYGDSWADRHLLREIGTPVAVLPDKKLAALAARLGWEVISDSPVSAASRDPANAR